jgi:hypothetical protein
VLAPVYFHDEPVTGRDEVTDVSGERDLATKGDAAELAIDES